MKKSQLIRIIRAHSQRLQDLADDSDKMDMKQFCDIAYVFLCRMNSALSIYDVQELLSSDPAEKNHGST